VKRKKGVRVRVKKGVKNRKLGEKERETERMRERET
jgi:hypothetical protein